MSLSDKMQQQCEAMRTECNEEALMQDSLSILTAIIEQTTDAVFVKDLRGRYLMVNSSCTQLLGMPREEVIGKDDAQLLPPETARQLAEVDRRVMATGETRGYEEVLPVTGQLRTYLSTKGVYRDDWGNAIGIIGISRDITERKRAEEELRRLNQELAERERELRRMVRRIVAIQEEEHRRVAYEVHDGFTQTAAAAYRHLQTFAEHRRLESAEDREELEDAIALVRRTVEEARSVIANLRPTTLDDFGLAAAIQLQVVELQTEGFEASYEGTLGEERLPSTLEVNLFRVTQEALSNVRKHAETDRVRVAIGRRDGAVRLEVRDWGRGFCTSEVRGRAGTGETVGLSSMRDRVALLSGSLEIRSEPGIGTSVVAEIPLPAAGEEKEEADDEG
jgi:PAS domain S-box-containing protein